ncbi:MAG: sugar-binding domain-containing protein, partial [Bacillota bacterium]
MDSNLFDRSSRLRAHLAATLFLAVCILLPHPIQAADSPRDRILFNSDWRFTRNDPPGVDAQLAYKNIKPWVLSTGRDFLKDPASVPTRPEGNLAQDISYTQPNFDDSSWCKLTLPHDWGIEGGFEQKYPGDTGKLGWWGVGWYRKHFSVAANDQGRQFFLDIDGAMAYAMVWLNGQFVGGWPYGYTSFRLDLSPYIKPGQDNVLAIRLDNPPNSSRWYPGGGIYRKVWLVKTS